MFRNYLKTAFRNLVRYKIYSAINIIGLAVGLAACMLIVLYVGHESSYDRFHKNADRIFWLQTRLKIGNDSVYMPFLNYSAGPMVKQRIPSVESFMRLRKDDRNTIVQNPEKPAVKFAESKFLFADSNFFNFFSFRLFRGNPLQVLNRPFSLVITQAAARKYFGNIDPIGKTIRYNNSDNFLVTGIADDAPSNSSIDYDFIASISSMSSIKEQADLVKNEKNDFTTYFLLKKNGQISGVENELSRLTKERDGDDGASFRYVSTSLPNLHLVSALDTTNIKYLKIFPFVAALVLLLALINYMSLSTARASIRAREIGVRKVLGAGKNTIAVQFFAESALYTTISFILGYIMCVLFQPFFFNFLQIDIDVTFLYQPVVLLSFAGLLVITVAIAGTYPSLLLSAYKPVAVLYGKLRGARTISVRRFFTVFQFSIAIIFILCGIVMQRQMHFFRNKDIGMKRDNIVMVPFGNNVSKHYPAFKQEMRTIAGVQQMSIALHPLFKGYDMMGITPPATGKMILMPTLDVDQQFISMLGLKWKFPPADSFFYRTKNKIVLNETGAEKLGLGQNPINQKVDQFEVAGVLKDFNWSSLAYKIEGLLLSVTTDDDSAAQWAGKGGCLFAKVNAGTNIPTLIDELGRIHSKFDSENPFEYYFMDDVFNDLYKAEERLAKILTSFTILAIVIACVGLFGLISFMAVQRTKEIGIRKTLGASVQSIVRLLSGDFLMLVIIAFILASPVAWHFMNQWLQDFAYRIQIKGWIFLFAGFVAVVIAFITISTQAIKAAIANPVESLRTE